ncbi:MAG: alpha-L-fucosidase [Spirosomataceae bacterium]
MYKILILSLVTSLSVLAQPAPKPYGVLPSERQLRWHETEQYCLIHFTPTTFEDKEWGYGDAKPASFNPTQFDAEQIVKAAKAGGLRGLILVAKHHDGFCLWPTKTTDYNISKSPFRDGKGDVVREFEQACRENGLKFGVYCSPWDRNSPYYGTAEYVKRYRQQLTELYTQYGPLFMSWHDGANGGDGYYGGAKEARKIDRLTYYGWDSTWTHLTRKLQPTACIFSDVGWDVRWVGNEKGFAAETSWATFTPRSPDRSTKGSPGYANDQDSPEGTRNGEAWIPAECDVPLRPGWFYHPAQDTKVRTPQELFDLYFKSVGRGACLDLGLAPDTRGLLHENDVASLKAFGELVSKTFARNLAKTAKLSPSNIRGNNKALYGVQRLMDTDRYSYWATDDSNTTPEVVVSWTSPQTFDVVRLRENIKLGQRIEGFALDIWENNAWKEVHQGTSIGSLRLVRLSEAVSTTQVRLRITKSPVCIALSELGVYKASL